jgi:CTP:molybdopterin cytidylyltransferase MocA
MGANKLLLPVEGRPLVARAIDAAFAAGCLDDVVVVLGRDAQEIEGSISDRSGLRFEVNPDYETGQASSLRAGLRTMSAGVDAVVVLLGDQPEVRPDAIRAVVLAYREQPAPILQATYGGRGAHPTLLARAAWPEAEAERGDVGARALIRRHPEWRRIVEVGGDPPEDVDTEADYRRLLSRLPDG